MRLVSSDLASGKSQPPAPSGTGFPDLDRVLQGLRVGDNVVWQVTSIDEYLPFVRSFAKAAVAAQRRVVYFRFARHVALVEEGPGITVHRLSPTAGFDSFTAQIHSIIEEFGPGTYYVFDCLSDLAADWYSDLMLGNFFTVTCPYLFELATVTYFALLRDSHSPEALEAIRNTTQVLLEVFQRGGALYLRPLKVEARESATTKLPHLRSGDRFAPVTERAAVAEMLADLDQRRLDSAPRQDLWDRKFLQAQEVLDGVQSANRPSSAAEETFHALLPVLLTRDERIAELASRWLGLEDLLQIYQRMIGSGLVGGKAVGMLLARAILVRSDPRWRRRLEPHDSWFVGSDVFYTYLVRNGCWRARREHRRSDSFLEGIAETRERLLGGTFSEPIHNRFAAMLEHYGPTPIIVRSSSLLEDGFGSAFTGKYESVFCPNQGSPEQRLRAFEDAVRTVYASAVSEEALRYRERRGLLDRDEQMAVLVQRVSGSAHGSLFFPQVAGVALSYNPYVWHSCIDPAAGVVRLVFGLGTRAVERADDDYTRLVALNEPLRRPEHSLDDVPEYSQHRVDVIDLAGNRLTSLPFEEVARQSPTVPFHYFAGTRPDGAPVLTFDALLSTTPYVTEMRSLLSTLEAAYRYPVDVEFTASFLESGELLVNIVQCRPLQVKEGGVIQPPPTNLPETSILLASRGPVVGRSTVAPVDRMIYVDPDGYAALPSHDRYEVARIIGRLTRIRDDGRTHLLLLGPGRWGTSTISLGVPVSFAEIQRASAICEIVRTELNVIPDVSLGSHFFNDLVEENMLYLAVYPDRSGHRLDEALIRRQPNRLADLLPDDQRLAEVVRVIDFPLYGDGRTLLLSADSVRQEVFCYLDPLDAANPAVAD